MSDKTIVNGVTLRHPNFREANEWCERYKGLGLSWLYFQVTDEDARPGSGRGKGPCGLDAVGWNQRTYGMPPPHEKPWQVGLFTGVQIGGDPAREPHAGCWLACVDVDDPDMQVAVESALPKTGLVGGRAGAPRSHLFYAVTDGQPNSFKWHGPRKDDDGSERDGCLLEIRGCDGNGAPTQTVVAPSRHFRTAADVVWDAFGPPACVTASDLYNACLRALEVKGQGVAKLDGKGRPKPPVRKEKVSRGEKLASARNAAQETAGDDAGKPRAKVLSARDVDDIVARAEAIVTRQEKGNVQATLNAQAFGAASVLAGAGCGEEVFDRLRDTLVALFDAREGEGHDVRKWITTVERGIRQGRDNPRVRRVMQGYGLNDQGSADMLEQEWRDRFRFLVPSPSDGGGGKAARGEWREWDGTKWAPIDNETLVRATAEVFRWAGAQAALSDDKEWSKDAQAYYFGSESRNKGQAAVDLMRARQYRGGLSVLRETVDTDRWLVNCRNGIFDIKAGVLVDHDRSKMMTKEAPFDYVPGLTSPMAEAAIRWQFETQPDPLACYRYLLSWLGYCATGDVSAQQLLVLFGNGRNGKSKLIEACGKVLGTYAGTVQKSVMISTNSESKCTDEIAELQGRRMGWFSELTYGEFLNEGRIKQLTGNTRVRGRRLFEGSFEFDMQCKFLLDTNYQPRIRGTDFGILRRVKPLPYARQIPETMVIPDWDGKVVAEEGSGLLSMLLDAAHLYSKHGLAPEPLCVKAACEQFAQDNDHLGSFLGERCEVMPEHDALTEPAAKDPAVFKCGASELYSEYRRWATDGGYTPLNIKNFASKLADKGFVQTRIPVGRVWLGVRLMPLSLQGGIEALDAMAEKTKDSAKPKKG